MWTFWSRDGLKTIHDNLEDRGYLPLFTGSKHLRDTELGVKIEFLVSGGFPGDGKPKPVALPDPAVVTEIIDGRKHIRLTSLLELKLASGMSSEQRAKNLIDVQQLIRAAHLPLDLADQLHPYVQEKYRTLWSLEWPAGRRYLRAWPRDTLTKERLDGLLAEGLAVDPSRSSDPQFVFLATTDPQLAFRYDMPNESEYRDV